MGWEDLGLSPFTSPCSCGVVWEFLNGDIMAVVLFPPAEITMACGSCASGGHTDVLTEAGPCVLLSCFSNGWAQRLILKQDLMS